MSTQPSASGTVAAGSKLEKAIQNACETLGDVFKAEYDDDRIKDKLSHAWFSGQDVITRGEDSNLKKRLRTESKFNDYVAPGSNGEQELVNLLRRMVRQEVPWRND
jgi:hypothetical protein